jgi:tetratricopeptide (TPR) repeat protein
MYLNRGGTFQDASLSAWVADYRGAMGLTTGDWNRDGDDDLFVTHWMAQENALYDSRLIDFARQRGEAPAQLSFSDLSAPVGLGQPALQSVGWGTEFVDLDADGWLDLPIANGSTLESRDDSRRLKPQAAMLFWNETGTAFHNLAPLSEVLATPSLGRGLAVADYDRDGDQDLLVVHLDGGVMLLANEMQTGSWVEIRLRYRGADGAPSGFGDGSQVVVRTSGAEHRRAVTSASYLSQSSRTLHFGLGDADSIESVEVYWLGGEFELFPGVVPGGVWELVEGTGEVRRIVAPAAVIEALTVDHSRPTRGVSEERKARLREFWTLQRRAMDFLKLDGDCRQAIDVFGAALALEPDHEDSLYYRANCLATVGRYDDALGGLARLRQVNPMSHRGHMQWGVLRAMTANSRAQLEEAEKALERALELNQEETGSLLALGEISLLLGDLDLARERFEKACRTNPQAAGGFYLLAFLAAERGDRERSRELLAEVRRARGPEWKPEGAVAEGDTAARMHVERTPLAHFVDAWDGKADPDPGFAELKRHISSFEARRAASQAAPQA